MKNSKYLLVFRVSGSSSRSFSCSKEEFLDSKDVTSIKSGIFDSYSIGNYIKNESSGVKILDTKLEFEVTFNLRSRRYFKLMMFVL